MRLLIMYMYLYTCTVVALNPWEKELDKWQLHETYIRKANDLHSCNSWSKKISISYKSQMCTQV